MKKKNIAIITIKEYRLTGTNPKDGINKYDPDSWNYREIYINGKKVYAYKIRPFMRREIGSKLDDLYNCLLLHEHGDNRSNIGKDGRSSFRFFRKRVLKRAKAAKIEGEY